METLFIHLQSTSELPLYEQIYEQIRDDIIRNTFQPNDKLPSKRKLAQFLNVSQTTIELAYAQLVAEGYIRSEPRRGFFVERIDELLSVTHAHIPKFEIPKETTYRYDFSPGTVDTSQFPFATWRKYAKEVMDPTASHLLQLGHPHGDQELRVEIANYIYQSRGVQCTPDQIIIGSGTEQLMSLLLRVLGSEAIYGIENPGYLLTHPVFEHHNRPTIPIPVDRDGMQVQQLVDSAATVAFVTPSHQFPTGTVLSASRKAMLLNWAYEQEHHFIIEDDYDSEFRYTGKPIPSLQSMDQHGKVIYMSTFSKAFMPSLRIAYLVLPSTLYGRYEQTFLHYAATVPRFDQQIVARFMKHGHFARHLNRMRTIYRKKMNSVIQRLDQYEQITYYGEHAGMHVTIEFDHDWTEEQLVKCAKENGIRIVGMSQYEYRATSTKRSFLLGFGSIPTSEIDEAIATLCHIWKISKREPR